MDHRSRAGDDASEALRQAPDSWKLHAEIYGFCTGPPTVGDCPELEEETVRPPFEEKCLLALQGPGVRPEPSQSGAAVHGSDVLPLLTKGLSQTFRQPAESMLNFLKVSAGVVTVVAWNMRTSVTYCQMPPVAITHCHPAAPAGERLAVPADYSSRCPGISTD